MLLSVLTAVTLAAGPTGPKLAAPGFSSLNLSPEATRYYSEHFAHQLAAEGIGVLTSSEMGTLIGLERQKQLMGCVESACAVELANALGVDGVVTGSLGKFDTTFQVNIKIIASTDGKALATHTAKVKGEPALLDEYSSAAKKIAAELKQLKSGKAAPEVASAPASPPAPSAPTPSATPTSAAPPGSCEGQKCAADGDCCTGQCLNKVCAAAKACVKEKERCRDATDCCAGFGCDKAMTGTCLPVRPGAQPNGYACVASDQCNYGLCTEAGVCADPTEILKPACRGVGMYCNPDSGKRCCAQFTCHTEYPAACCLPPDSRCTRDESCCSGKCVGGECG